MNFLLQPFIPSVYGVYNVGSATMLCAVLLMYGVILLTAFGYGNLKAERARYEPLAAIPLLGSIAAELFCSVSLRCDVVLVNVVAAMLVWVAIATSAGALLRVLEGVRGQPRHRLPAQSGSSKERSP